MVIQTTQQCSCRWILRHQHKLKQAARSCHLRVKEALFGGEDTTATTPTSPANRPPYEQNEKAAQPQPLPQPEIETFRFADLKVTTAEPHTLRLKPDVSELKFGQFFTDHMLKVFYHSALGGWQKPEIIPFENISLHPAAKVLHYAIELFEGYKAYRGVDGRIRVFRPDMNMHRMNLSAKASGLPTFDCEELLKCINRLVAVDQEWVPHAEGASLYVRPTLIGIDGTLGVSQSESALLFTILCPVGNYFSTGAGAVSLLADPTYARAWPGGCGDRKVGSNYGPTIRVQKQATQKGLQQVLWLYGEDHQITEVGTMNIFMFYINEDGEKELATPPLNGLILPGITRASIIQLAQEWGDFRVVQRSITMAEVIQLIKEEKLLEMFGCGTACIVSPIASISYLGNNLKIPTMEHSKPLFNRIREELYAIQYGHVKHPWGVLID